MIRQRYTKKMLALRSRWFMQQAARNFPKPEEPKKEKTKTKEPVQFMLDL